MCERSIMLGKSFVKNVCCSCITSWSLFAGVSPIHNGQVCSTWGNFHFKTFDGDVFQLRSTCNYGLTSSCRSSYNDFNIQLRRQDGDGRPIIKNIIMKLEGSVVELSKGFVVVDGKAWVYSKITWHFLLCLHNVLLQTVRYIWVILRITLHFINPKRKSCARHCFKITLT